MPAPSPAGVPHGAPPCGSTCLRGAAVRGARCPLRRGPAGRRRGATVRCGPVPARTRRAQPFGRAKAVQRARLGCQTPGCGGPVGHGRDCVFCETAVCGIRTLIICHAAGSRVMPAGGTAFRVVRPPVRYRHGGTGRAPTVIRYGLGSPAPGRRMPHSGPPGPACVIGPETGGQTAPLCNGTRWKH